MGQGGHFGNELDVVMPCPFGQIRNLGLLENSAVGDILVGRVLIFAVRTGGAVFEVRGEPKEMPSNLHNNVDFRCFGNGRLACVN